MKNLYLIFLGLFFTACQIKSVQNNGGIIIDLEIGDSLSNKNDISKTAEIIKQRVEMICHNNPLININNNSIHIEMPLMNDTNICKTLLIQPGQFEISESYEAKDVLVYLSDINKKLVENHNFNFTFPIDSTLLPDNPLFNLISIQYDQDIKAGPECGLVMTKDTALINSVFNHPSLSLLLPRDLKFKWSKDQHPDFCILIACKINLREKLITSEMIQDAKVSSQNGNYEITFELKEEYRNRWKRITRANISHSLIITIDENVIFYPIVQDEIAEGKSSITGNYSEYEAKAIASILKYGIITTPVKIKNLSLQNPN